MDKKYFLNDGKKQFGPLSLDEISKMPLKETNMVWVDAHGQILAETRQKRNLQILINRIFILVF